MSKRKEDYHETSSSLDEEDSEVESLSAEEEEEIEKIKETKKNDKKRKPATVKKAGSAYTFYMKERQQKIKEENPELTFGQISTKVGSEWKSMTEEQKKPYMKLAEEDKKRFDKEKAESPELFEKGNNKRTKKKKTEKDPNAPKKNKNAYMFFSQDIRPKIVEELGPEMSKKVTVVQQVVGTRWKQLTPEQKTPYEEMAKKDKERYAKELEAYKNSK